MYFTAISSLEHGGRMNSRQLKGRREDEVLKQVGMQTEALALSDSSTTQSPGKKLYSVLHIFHVVLDDLLYLVIFHLRKEIKNSITYKNWYQKKHY